MKPPQSHLEKLLPLALCSEHSCVLSTHLSVLDVLSRPTPWVSCVVPGTQLELNTHSSSECMNDQGESEIRILLENKAKNCHTKSCYSTWFRKQSNKMIGANSEKYFETILQVKCNWSDPEPPLPPSKRCSALRSIKSPKPFTHRCETKPSNARTPPQLWAKQAG